MYYIKLKNAIYIADNSPAASFFKDVEWFDVRGEALFFTIKGKTIVTPIHNLEYLREV